MATGDFQVETAYDWLTVAIFAGLVVLFLQRSSAEDASDPFAHYLAASAGCAVSNYLGNEEHHLLAIGTVIATLGYIFYFIRPFAKPRQS
jgi:hypothetical protein